MRNGKLVILTVITAVITCVLIAIILSPDHENIRGGAIRQMRSERFVINLYAVDGAPGIWTIYDQETKKTFISFKNGMAELRNESLTEKE